MPRSRNRALHLRRHLSRPRRGDEIFREFLFPSRSLRGSNSHSPRPPSLRQHDLARIRIAHSSAATGSSRPRHCPFPQRKRDMASTAHESFSRLRRVGERVYHAPGLALGVRFFVSQKLRFGFIEESIRRIERTLLPKSQLIRGRNTLQLFQTSPRSSNLP